MDVDRCANQPPIGRKAEPVELGREENFGRHDAHFRFFSAKKWPPYGGRAGALRAGRPTGPHRAQPTDLSRASHLKSIG